jgi:hypothetical protein
MIKKHLWIILLILSINTYGQYKPDVIVFGGSVAGASTAIQAARSGVKTLLILPDESLLSNPTLSLEVPAFDLGLWKEWKDAYQLASDSVKTTPEKVLENIIGKINNLQVIKASIPNKIEEKKNGWEVTVPINGKNEEIKCKVIVDATSDYKSSPINSFGILSFDEKGKFVPLVNYSTEQKNEPYQQLQKLYRTSGAAGFGKDSSLNYIPLGVFIPQEKPNLIIISTAAFKDFSKDDFQNVALWTNIGQAAGALAAFGPFFDTTPSKANIRLTQAEMFTHKSFLYPVLDIAVTDSAFYPVQKIIASGILNFDFKTGKFNPDEKVKISDFKATMSTQYPRSKIWFIENKKVSELSSKDLISLISFTATKDPYNVNKEISSDWESKYHFDGSFSDGHLITKKEMTILFEVYLQPFNINVDFNGYYLR